MKIIKNRSLIIGVCCILMTAGLVEDAAFRITLLAIALLIGIVLAFDVLRSTNN